MRSAAIGEVFDERGAEIGAGAFGGPLRRGIHGEEVIAIHAQRRDAAAHAARSERRRFAAGEWSATPGSAFLAEMYLLNSRTLLAMAEALQADAKTRSRVRFAALQWIDAASPSNFLALNPEALKKAAK